MYTTRMFVLWRLIVTRKSVLEKCVWKSWHSECSQCKNRAWSMSRCFGLVPLQLTLLCKIKFFAWYCHVCCRGRMNAVPRIGRFEVWLCVRMFIGKGISAAEEATVMWWATSVGIAICQAEYVVLENRLSHDFLLLKVHTPLSLYEILQFSRLALSVLLWYWKGEKFRGDVVVLQAKFFE